MHAEISGASGLGWNEGVVLEKAWSISTPDLHEAIQAAVKLFAAYRHFHCIKGVFHDIIGIELVDAMDHAVHVWLLRLCEQKELDPSQGLEALHSKVARLQHLDTRRS